MGDDAAARLAALEAKVDRLADIEDIRLLRMRYHEAINEGYFERIPEMFTEDGAVDFDYIGRAQGRSKISRFFARTPEVLPFIKQFIHNHVIDVDGDAGTGFSYLEAKTVAKGEAFVVAARYDDVYAPDRRPLVLQVDEARGLFHGAPAPRLGRDPARYHDPRRVA